MLLNERVRSISPEQRALGAAEFVGMLDELRRVLVQPVAGTAEEVWRPVWRGGRAASGVADATASMIRC